MELDLILEWDLTTFPPPSGTITDIHVHQHDSGRWYINVRLSWRGAALFHVGLYDKKRIRLYKKLSSAVCHIVYTYAYTGMIAVHPHPDLQDTGAY
jgi:hypothetical protein